MWLFEYCHVSVLVLYHFGQNVLCASGWAPDLYPNMSTESVCELEQHLNIFKCQNLSNSLSQAHRWFWTWGVSQAWVVFVSLVSWWWGCCFFFGLFICFILFYLFFECSSPLMPSWLPSASGEDEHAHCRWQHGPLHLHAHGSNPHRTGDQAGLRSVIQPPRPLRSEPVLVHF